MKKLSTTKELSTLNIREIKLYDCTLDGDFKETTEGNYSSIFKLTYSCFENSLILFELNKEQYEYITSLDYKEIRFNVKGHMQVRKNKKDVPFLYFKVNFIMSKEDLAKVKQEFISWKPFVKELNFKQKLINPMKIKLLDAEHRKNNSIKIQYRPTCVFSEIFHQSFSKASDTNEYIDF